MDREMQLKVIQFRKLFEQFPKEVQVSETERLDRVVAGVSAIVVTNLDPKDEREYRFNKVSEVVAFLKYNGEESAHNSNVYKALRGERKSAYGFKIVYEE